MRTITHNFGKDKNVLPDRKSKCREETADFLRSPTSRDSRYVTYMEQGTCRKCTIVYPLVTLLLVGTVVVGLELVRSREAAGFQAELDSLRQEVESLKQDFLEQLKVCAEEAAVDDDYDDDDDYGSIIDPHSNGNKDVQHTGRGRREIATPVVPVISESYGLELKHHNVSNEGLRLYGSLGSSNTKSEAKTSVTEIPYRATPKSPLKKYVGPSPSRHQRGGTPSPIISRVSRVMQTDSINSHEYQLPLPPPTPQLRSLAEHRLSEGIVVPVIQEQRAPQGAVVRSPSEGLNITKTRRRKKLRPHRLPQIEGLDEIPEDPSRTPIAVHYDGDISKYRDKHHPHYQGNGRLQHPDGNFTDWTPSEWSQNMGMGRFFTLHAGTVTVKENGVYFIYAQIYYVDEHDINGFRVYVNNAPFLHCTTMTVHPQTNVRKAKSNTCHTSAAIYLAPGDQVSLRDVDGLRYSLFEPAKSFFGLIRLGYGRMK